MTDKELLELAARAANYELEEWISGTTIICEGFEIGGKMWNPLTDDGDALRLAVKLCLGIDHNHRLDNERWTSVLDDTGRQLITEEFEDESFRALATRRAIVRAAAETGRAL